MIIRNDYPWLLDPRWGRITVYVDGRKAGTAPVRGQVVVALPSGMHKVRTRLWWFTSPVTTIRVADEPVTLRTDVRRDKPLLGAIALMVVSPWTGLTLTTA